MSDRGGPGNPFGRSERTIVRPDPGGRRSAAPMPGTAPVPGVAPASGALPRPSADDWMAPPPPQPPREQAPRPVMFRLERLNPPSDNAIMSAAGPLLLALGQLRAGTVRSPSAELMEDVAQAVQAFESSARESGVPPDQILVAKYALCATADDIVQNMPIEDRHLWTQYSMLSRYFGERVGGVRFFQELDRARLDPARNYSLLELMHTCLALGFQGIHRVSGDGPAALQHIQRNLYETLRRVRPQAPDDLSPHWQGQDLPARLNNNRVPLWAVSAVLGALLLGVYLACLFLLDRDARSISTALADLTPIGEIELARPEPVPPPPPPPPPPPTEPRRITQLERIRAALVDQISAGKANADQTANEIVITVGDVSVFDTGKTQVMESFVPVANRIAETLETEPGFVRIVGHTDNVPIRTSRFASNYELSVERAKAVAELFRKQLDDPSRLQVLGKGADMPIASNKTPEGRARNRRVEITIPRAD